MSKITFARTPVTISGTGKLDARHVVVNDKQQALAAFRFKSLAEDYADFQNDVGDNGPYTVLSSVA